MRSLICVALLILAIPRLAIPGEPGQSGKVAAPTPPAAPIGDFSERVDGYVKLRKRVEDSVDGLKTTKDSAAIAAHRTELAGLIVTARSDAHQGDIFTPKIAAKFRDIIRKTYRAPGAQAVRRTIQDKEAAKVIVVRVNMEYPEKNPLQTMPPTLLGLLPDLPMDMAYQIVDRAFVLLDNKTRLIVDFIPDVLP